MKDSIVTETARSTFLWGIDQGKTPALRPVSQWVEDKIILPGGPFEGERYSHSRHPASRLWFDAIDSGRWNRNAATGPTQNGKTLMFYVLPILYHLFEIQETVGIGIPTMDMANDKWEQDFLPAIEATPKLASLLPSRGEGSRGGQVKRSITFQNGVSLRFFTFGGSDKSVSGYTARVIAITETDGADELNSTSRETDRIKQIEARTRAFGRTGKRVYLECTASIESGRIWQEITNGTDSRIIRPCQYCELWVTPEREHLTGWQDAKSSEEAADKAYFICPLCEHEWDEQDRINGWSDVKLLHSGQEITPKGRVVGKVKKTQTLGFRWSAIDNPFTTIADLGAEEWDAKNSANRENAEREMRQFVWAIPAESDELDLDQLDFEELQNRTGKYKRGIVPENALGVVVGVDTNKAYLHWQAHAVLPNETLVIEHGVQHTECKDIGMLKGLVKAALNLKSYFDSGYNQGSKKVVPSIVIIDSGFAGHTNAIYSFCDLANQHLGKAVYRPSKGYGIDQPRMTVYRVANSKDVKYAGNQYHIQKVRRAKKLIGVELIHIDSDFWKTQLHDGLSIGQGNDGAVVLYEPSDPHEHDEYIGHIMAERKKEIFVPGRGIAVKWFPVAKHNHQLDAGYEALVAGDILRRGVKLSFSPSKNPKYKRPTLEEMRA